MERVEPSSIVPHSCSVGSAANADTTAFMNHPDSNASEEKMGCGNLDTSMQFAPKAVLEKFFNGSLEALAITDSAGCLVDVNAPFCELLEESKATLIGRSLTQLLEPALNLGQALQTHLVNHRITGEGTLHTTTHTIRRVEYAITPGILPGLSLVSLRDSSEYQQLKQAVQQLNQKLEQAVEQRTASLQAANTQLQAELQRRKQSEEKLRQQEKRYRSLVFATSQAVWIADANGAAMMVTPAWSAITGQQEAQHHGNGWLDVVHPDERDWVQQAWMEAVNNGTVYDVEYRIINAHGEERYVAARGVPVRSSDGQVREWIGTTTDITDRKQAEEQLRQSEANLAAAQKVARLGNWEYDLSTQKIAWSEALFHIYGLNPDQAEPDYDALFQKFFPEDCDKLKQAVERAIMTGESYEIDLRLPQADGSIRYLETRGEAVCDSHGRVTRLFGTTQDITDRKQLEELLRSQAERETLLSDVTQRIRQSLDLNTILNTTVNEVRHLLQADRVLIYRIPVDGNGFVITEAVAPTCSPIIDQSLPAEIFPSDCHQLYCQGRTRAIANIEHSDIPACLVETLRQMGVMSKMVVPILFHAETSDRCQEHLWGLLIAHQCKNCRHWQPAEVDFLNQLAAQVGIAIQQAELYQQVQHLNADLEQQVKERTTKLQQAYEFESTLKRITDKVRDSLDEDQILQSAVEELARVLSISCCNAALFDLERGTSTIRYEYTTALVSPSHGRVSKIADFPEIYDQILEGQYFQFCSLVPNPGRGRATMLCCPILDDQGVLGDLWLVNYPDYVFSDQDIRLVQQVANQCAIALRQACLYQAAQAQVEELERLNRLKDDFLSTVSHELRTPMSNIKMATQMLEIALRETLSQGDRTPTANQPKTTPKNRVGNPSISAVPVPAASSPRKTTSADPKVAHYLKILKTECQREINLINDLLDLSRLDSGTELPSKTGISLANWAPTIAESFVERAHSQQQQLLIDIPDTLPEILVNESYLERLLTELLTNACKYTPAGETITLAARLDADPNQPSIATPPDQGMGEKQCPLLQISVTNTGVVIPEDEHDRIFDTFYRIPSNDPWKHGGTGLGLALVKRLAGRLGGDIQLESGNGKTTFTLRLGLPETV